jgi:hypothetical protein
VSYNDGTWRDHRDELFDRVVKRGRARKRRRGFLVGVTVIALVLAVAGGLYLPDRDTHTLRVAKTPHDTTTTVPPAQSTGVLLIGDSLMQLAKLALEQTIPDAHVDTAAARQFGDANAILEAAKSHGGLPPTIVIHLGDNGPSEGDVFDKITTEFQSIMDTVGSDSEVYFLSLKLPRSWEAKVNSALYSEVAAFPNAHVLAWHDFSRSRDDWFLSDEFHLSPAGQAAYAAFIRDGIRAPVATYTDPFDGGPIPSTGLLVTDDAKGGGPQAPASYTMKLVDDSGNELGAVPRGVIDNDVWNSVRHTLVVTDDGIHLETVPLDHVGDLPSGCVPTEKVQAVAVALCGEVYGGIQVIGKRILVNKGSGWSQLIGLPPVPAGQPAPLGHWTWAAPSPDGGWIAAGWSGECEVPTGIFVSVADGSVHTVTGEAGDAWPTGPNSGIVGWHAAGPAMGVFGGDEEACGSAAPAQRGLYLVSPDDIGSRDLLLPLTPSQAVLRWTSVDDRRAASNRHGAEGEIAYAFGHFFDPALTADERAALIQGSAEMRAFLDRAFAAHAAEVAAGAIVVDDVTVHESTADVSFHALVGGRESPVNPGQISGTAVLESGTWKISRTTFCTLSANGGEPCPPRFEEALRTLGVDLDAAPEAVRNLASLEFCGSEQFQGSNLAQSLNEAARRCFLDRYGSGRPAVFVMEQTSVEGDPIVTIYHSTTDKHVELFVDATRDSFGSGKWESQRCGGVTTEFPNAPSPLPPYYFDGEGCS